MSEAQRFARLREQDGRPIEPPPALAHLFHEGGLEVRDVDEAHEEWKRARADYAKGAGFPAAERLFFLTLALRKHLRAQGKRTVLRSMLETTSEILDDVHQRQMLHAMIAQEAALEGDLDAATRWLELASPHSEDLRSDTAYRVARTLIATRRNKIDDVLEVLGRNALDVPIEDEEEGRCTLLRANALEMREEDKLATQQLAIALSSPKIAKAIRKARSATEDLGLCAKSFQAAERTAEDLRDSTTPNPNPPRSRARPCRRPWNPQARAPDTRAASVSGPRSASLRHEPPKVRRGVDR